MKKLIVALTTTLACVGAFAQGKISFQNDSLRLAYYSSTAPGDAALQGQGVSSGAGMPSGVTLVADLYMGTSASVLQLYRTTAFSVSPGKWTATAVSSGFPGLTPPGGSTVFIVTQIRDQAFAAPATYLGIPFGSYYGVSEEFQFTLGSAATYPVMWGTSGTWSPGTFNMDQYGPGSRGAIPVGLVAPIPEPTSFALAGLGAAALFILRRRK